MRRIKGDANHYVNQINDGNVQRSMIDSLTVIFSSSVTLSGTPFTLERLDDSSYVGLSVSGSGTTYTITFTGSTDITYGSLTDGEYTFSINHSDVSGISGFTSNQSFTFHRLYGDYLGTGTVTAGDYSLIHTLFGHSCPSADWYFDYDGDGYIASYDFVEFDDNYGLSASAPDSGAIFSPTTETDFYYSSMGQIIQEDSVSGGVSTLSMQYVWGEAYVNELILRDSNADGSTSTGNLGKSGSGLEQRLYALQDANYDITSLVDTTGTVQQRMLYDAWGNPTYTDSSYDATGNGYNFEFGWQWKRESNRGGQGGRAKSASRAPKRGPPQQADGLVDGRAIVLVRTQAAKDVDGESFRDDQTEGFIGRS